MLLDKNHWDSAVVLTRSLFELAVNLAYIDENVAMRLPEYLKHGGMATTSEEAEERRKEIKKGDRSTVTNVVPGQAWKRLSGMCKDLGPDWLSYYQTFYRFASVPTHAGSFTLGRSYLQLLEQQPPTDHDKATTLVTALAFHLSVAEVAAKTFPQQIRPDRIEELRNKCLALGKSLT